jgi:hypothetical protein
MYKYLEFDSSAYIRSPKGVELMYVDRATAEKADLWHDLQATMHTIVMRLNGNSLQKARESK